MDARSAPHRGTATAPAMIKRLRPGGRPSGCPGNCPGEWRQKLRTGFDPSSSQVSAAANDPKHESEIYIERFGGHFRGHAPSVHAFNRWIEA